MTRQYSPTAVDPLPAGATSVVLATTAPEVGNAMSAAGMTSPFRAAQASAALGAGAGGGVGVLEAGAPAGPEATGANPLPPPPPPHPACTASAMTEAASEILRFETWVVGV